MVASGCDVGVWSSPCMNAGYLLHILPFFNYFFNKESLCSFVVQCNFACRLFGCLKLNCWELRAGP